MPIPKPTSNENEKEFISRCISEISGEYDQKVAAGICYTQWRRKDKMSAVERVRQRLDEIMKK